MDVLRLREPAWNHIIPHDLRPALRPLKRQLLGARDALQPQHIVCGIGLALLRASSPEFRAYTDIFVPRFERAADWQSGLRDSHYLLYAVARALRPGVVVEIGSARGKSTCTLALACSQNQHGMVYAIDPHEPNAWSDLGVTGDSYEFLRARLRAYSLGAWCRVIRATSAQAASDWSRPIDLLFVDGDHTYEGVKQDFEAFRPWLSPTAVVLFHDTTWEYYRSNPYYREDIGVPAYMAELQRAGYHSVTIDAAPGLTLLCPRPGGFDFLPDSLDRSVARCE
jgi:predicted O-methyltransferase YrrM